MATNNTAEATMKKLEKEMVGKTSITLEDEAGVTYVAKFPRKLVKEMEERGITAEYASKVVSEGTVAASDKFFEEFVLPAFNVEQKMTLEQVEDLFEGLEDPMVVISALIILFTAPVRALFEKKNPTQTRTKFSLV